MQTTLNAAQFDQHRQALYKYAVRAVSDPDLAQDLVQDTFVAALGAGGGFRGDSTLRTWLVGILKHKITDRLRGKYRPEVGYSEAFADDLDNVLFNARGHWVDGVAPSVWRTPEDQLHTDQFFAVVDICVQKLPPKTARVFSMKEFLECDADEVCDTLGLSKADYWQCMSRARKQIQLCLHQNWFEGVTP